MYKIEDLEKEYISKHQRSKELYMRANNCFPGGVTHDSRFAEPFPIYMEKALGSKKWDVDGNEYVDYVMGHGALLLGYGDERVTAAFREQIEKAVHMGSCTELEIEWAEMIKKLVPSARDGLVRATSCGTEAVQMAIRLSRIYTERKKIVIFGGSYHGKGDNTICAYKGPPFKMFNVRGIPQSILDDVIIVPFNNLEAVEEALATKEVACLILHGNNLYTRDFVKGLRELTTQYGTVFIIDEVISGFRYSAGGAQEYYGVTPDLSVLGKIIGGGAPIGAICGKKEIMDYYSFKDDYWNRFVRVAVGGTWNAQPICICGGIEVMKIIDKNRDTIYPKLYNIGKRLTTRFNELAEDLKVAAVAVGFPPDNPTYFAINLLNRATPPGKEYLWETGPRSFEDYALRAKLIANSRAYYAFYLSMINNGIFPFGKSSFMLCTKHSEEDIKKTEDAFEKSLEILKENNLVGKI